jgi:hypothetical protein
MCIETMSLRTALLPKFAYDVGYDVKLLQLISDYQKNPGTDTYKAVKKFLRRKKWEQQALQNTFNTKSFNTKSFNRIQLHIVDYEGNLLWSTSPLLEQDKIVLLYQASEYSNQATQGSAYKKFEDGSEYSLSWVSGSPLFFNGGALKTGTTISPDYNLDCIRCINNDNCNSAICTKGTCKYAGPGTDGNDEYCCGSCSS